MLPAIPAVRFGFITIHIPRLLVGGLVTTRCVSSNCPQENRPDNRAQRTRAAKQQLKYVEQASARSGNPSLLGHRSVPRFEPFNLDDSTNRGSGMACLQALVAGTRIQGFEQERVYAICTGNCEANTGGPLGWKANEG